MLKHVLKVLVFDGTLLGVGIFEKSLREELFGWL
jgi:hypothetical protein